MDKPLNTFDIDLSELLGSKAPARKPGKRLSLFAEHAGELQPTELVALAAGKDGSEPAAGTQHLQKIRQIHHTAARLMATGAKLAEVSLMTGMSVSRLSILKQDPAFDELLTFYADREDERFVSVQQRLETLGLDATAELHDRVLEDPESLSNSDLIELAKVSLDRAGHSPVKKTENRNLTLTANELQEIKTLARQREAIDGEVVQRKPRLIRPLRDVLPQEKTDEKGDQSSQEPGECGDSIEGSLAGTDAP